jgi:GWxTD domain-containing protein
MKNTLFLILIFAVSFYPQKRMEHPQQAPEFLLTDIIYLHNDNTTSAYLTYRIPHNRLLFEKTGERFEAAYRFSVEVFDTDSRFAERHIREGKITAENFEETSSSSKYSEGFLKFGLTEGEYKLISLFTDIKSNREFRLREGNIRINNENFLQSLIIKRDQCDMYELSLVNYGGNIPFDSNEYEILIPVIKPAGEYYVEVINNGRELIKQNIFSDNSANIRLTHCKGGLYLEEYSNSGVSYLSIKPGQQMFEGELLIKIFNEKRDLINTSNISIKWYNKPRTLMNRQLAIRLLKNIDEDESYKYILQADEEKFDSLFYDYWKKFDPTPNTAFNELMNEYYSRADYAAMNFGGLSGKAGMETDRGKIYIKFGKPVRVDRTSTEKGKIVEVWTYAKDRVFTFIDEKGTGEFNLLRG